MEKVPQVKKELNSIEKEIDDESNVIKGEYSRKEVKFN